MADTNAQKIKEILTRGAKKIIDKNHLKKKLLAGEKLRIKFGVDPSKPDLHLGHSVILRKLQKFQELGHQVVFIIGDFTARIGDPSMRSKIRPQLSAEEVEKNAKTYLEQVKKVVDLKKAEVLRNSGWYDKMKPDDFINLFNKITLARILERDDFEKRLKAQKDIYPHEILYPILQAYDSVICQADVELGGTDQLFNMLMGRTLQKRLGKPVQDVFTMSLLVGLDGKEKMSKSLGNYIGIIESPEQQYGKIMSIPDTLILDYFELTTDVSLEEINKFKKELKLRKKNPKSLKEYLAKEIVGIYWGKKEALNAEREFNKIFREKKLPSKIPELKIKEEFLNILDLLVRIKLSSSKSEAKRLIIEGGVKIDGKVWQDWRGIVKIKKRITVQVGKRRFIRII